MSAPVAERRRRPRLGYRPELDGLRAIAVLAVMAGHMPGVQLVGGFLGVDLFFVLSGFLITSLLLDEAATHGRVSLGAFYTRRALRLLPALIALLAALWIATLALGAHFSTTPALMAHVTLYTLVYVSNWVLAKGLSAWPAAVDHVWSLSVEEQFYLVWPVVLSICLWRGVRRRTVVLMLVSGIVAIVAWRAWLQAHGVEFARIYFATDTRADALLVGCVTAFAIAARRDLFERARAPLAIVGLLGIGVAFVTVNNLRPQWIWELSCFGLLSAATIAALVAGQVPFVSAALRSRPMVWTGRLSYGLYLWHFVVFYAFGRIPHPLARFDAVWASACSFAVATASMYLVERPFLRLKSRFERTRARPGEELEPEEPREVAPAPLSA